MSAELPFITPDWPAPPGVRAAFTLRTGGVSAGPYDSLNLGAGLGDSPEAVAENRRRVSKRLRLPTEPVWLEQVHGIEVVNIEDDQVRGQSGISVSGRAAAPLVSAWGAGANDNVHACDVRVGESGVVVAPPQGDASVAGRSGRVCAIRVADCMPVLFAARDGSAVGAAHAGWRGLAGGVLESTIRRLGVPASELIAWMGPAIGPGHFEVGDDVRAAFMAAGADTGTAFVPNARGRWQCDLYALARRKLLSLGVADVYGGGWCTYADPARFFSYRRDGQCGRMAALIWCSAG